MSRTNASKKRYVAIDTETTGVDFRGPDGARPFLTSICFEDGSTRYWRWDVQPFTRRVEVPERDKQEIIEATTGYIPVFHNAKFDIRALESVGISIAWDLYEDTLLEMVAYHLERLYAGETEFYFYRYSEITNEEAFKILLFAPITPIYDDSVAAVLNEEVKLQLKRRSFREAYGG